MACQKTTFCKLGPGAVKAKPIQPILKPTSSFMTLCAKPTFVKPTELQVAATKPKVVQMTTIDVFECTIFDVDDAIKKRIALETEQAKVLENELEQLKQTLGGLPKISSDRAILNQRIAETRKKIKDIQSTFDYGLYVFRTIDILKTYKNLLKSQPKKSFVVDKKVIFDPNDVERENLVHTYYSIAQNYIALVNIPLQTRKMICDGCLKSNFEISLDDDSIYICKECKIQREVFNDTPSFKDTNRVNMSSKYTYTRKGHFVDAVKKFQGTQNVDERKIKLAITTIQSEMKKHNLVAERGKKNSVTKDQVYMFLSEQSLSAHYDDLNLLYHMITGEPCPDLSNIIDGVMSDFDKLEEVLSTIKDEDRSNSLTVDYKLYKLLQRHGFRCRKDDFYILKTKVKEDEHDEKMKEAWDILGWEWIATF